MADGVAVVTGGGSGFGLAVARTCAARGHAVALLDIDGDRATAGAGSLTAEHGVPALALAVDVADPGAVEQAAAVVARDLGGADIVFSNVGVQQIGAFEGFPEEAWRWMLEVNVLGAARVARSFLPLLRASERPRLAFTASASVLVPAERLAAYQASKFAVVGLAETLRLELANDGIGVSVILPSGMITRHLESSLAARPAVVGGDIAPAADTEAMLTSNPGFARDVASPEEAARGVLDEVLRGEPYIVTHGDLVEGVARRRALLVAAAERGRDRAGPGRH